VRRAQAEDALAALGRKQRDDVVARHDGRDARTDSLDDARPLMAEDGRGVARRVGTGGGVEVGVADAAGDEPDEHLARAWLRQLDLLHDERLPELLEHGCPNLHACTVRSRRRRPRLVCME